LLWTDLLKNIRLSPRVLKKGKKLVATYTTHLLILLWTDLLKNIRLSPRVLKKGKKLVATYTFHFRKREHIKAKRLHKNLDQVFFYHGSQENYAMYPS